MITEHSLKSMLNEEHQWRYEQYGHYCNYARQLGYEPSTYTQFKDARKYFGGGIKELANVLHGGMKNETT